MTVANPVRHIRTAVLSAALGALIAVSSSALAVEIDFESAPNGSDAAVGAWPGVAIGPALVVDESTIESLTLHQAVGSWATSGDQGLFNAFEPTVVFVPDSPFAAFSLEFVSLPDPAGGFFQLEAQLWSGDDLIAQVLSDAMSTGDSGLHEGSLSLDGFLADRLIVQAVAPSECDGSPCITATGLRDNFFLDDLVIRGVPEPGVGLLLALSLLAVAGRSRP